MSASFARTVRVVKPGVGPTPKGVVASQHVLVSELGAEVLASGGNAVDAAVAVSFALGVLEPWMSGIGGGGAMMILPAGATRPKALHFGMRASGALDPAQYPLTGGEGGSDLFAWPEVDGGRNVRGGSSVAVPGQVAGLAEAHARYGRMPWADLLAPAIAHARAGLEVDWYAALMIASAARDLSRDDAAANLFLEEGRWPKVTSWTAVENLRLDQSALADTLQALSADGPRAFTHGELGARFVTDVAAAGGHLTRTDLADYRPEWQEPHEIPYRGDRLWVLPRRTAGAALGDAMRQWQADFAPAADPNAATWSAVARGLREAYARRLESEGDGESPDAPACTTHLSVVDRDGNMVALTQTLLSAFGARIVSPGTGLLANNGLMWFDPVPGRPNSLGPGKGCLMNICPTIGTSGERVFAIGASGGRKIMPAVGQIAMHLIDYGMSLDAAIAAPRIDVSGSAEVVIDDRLDSEIIAELAGQVQVRPARRLPFPYAFACPAGVLRAEGLNMAAAETMSPWGDGCEEP